MPSQDIYLEIVFIGHSYHASMRAVFTMQSNVIRKVMVKLENNKNSHLRMADPAAA